MIVRWLPDRRAISCSSLGFTKNGSRILRLIWVNMVGFFRPWIIRIGVGIEQDFLQ